MSGRRLRASAIGVVSAIAVLSPGAIAVAATPGWVEAAVVAPPAAPVMVSAAPFVDGIRVSWFRGAVSPTSPAPTSYVVTRSGSAGDVSVQVPTSASSTMWSYDDTALTVGDPVSYTVRAVNSGGTGAASDATTPAARLAWDGPYDGARSALVATWDSGSAAPFDLDSISADSGVRYPIDGSPAYGVDWNHSMDRVTAADGSYEVGTGEGQLRLAVRAGVPCVDPSGTATVSRTAYALAGLASQSVDAALDCANGHHLTLRFRWRSPDAYPLLRLTAPAVTTTAPGTTSTATATIRNAGNAPLDVTAVRLLPTPDGAPVGLAVTGTTCTAATVEPDHLCSVDLSFAPGAGATKESRAVVVLDTPLGSHEAGYAIGQLAGLGQQAPTATSQPSGLRLRWPAPTSVAPDLITTYRVERQDAGGPTPIKTLTPAQVTSDGWQHAVGTVPPGTQDYRVVMVTTDGRELTSPWTTVHVPENWLVLATSDGAVPVNPDEGWTPGGTFGYAPITGDGWKPDWLAFDPRRTSILASIGPAYGHGSIARLTPSRTSASIATSPAGLGASDVSPDGSRALVVRPTVSGATVVPGAVLVMDTATSVLTEVPNSSRLGNPQWLPDGSAFLAIENQSRIVRVDPATGARTTVLTDSNLSGLAVARTGRMAFIRAGGWYDQSIVETTLTGSGRRTIAAYSLPLGVRYDPTGRYLLVTGTPYTQVEESRLYDVSGGSPVLVAHLPQAVDGAWWDPVSAAPTATLALPAWTTSAPSIGIGAVDADDRVGGLTRRCRLDGADWTACTSSWRPGTLAAGRHTLEVQVTDPAGMVGTTSSAWQVDDEAPTATLGSLPSATLLGPLTLTWTAEDTGGSGLKTYDVRQRRASGSAGFGSWTTARTGVTARSTTLTVSQGYQYCLSVRARDVAGNVGAWSSERCTTVALDDRSLTTSRGWTRATASSALHRTLTRAASTGASLTRRNVTARRIGLVATTCRTCGSIDVFMGSTRLGRVSLASTTTRSRRVLWLPALKSTRNGTLTLRTTSSRAILVDGVLIAR